MRTVIGIDLVRERLARAAANGVITVDLAQREDLLDIDLVRRGGTISLCGVYGGMADPLPMFQPGLVA